MRLFAFAIFVLVALSAAFAYARFEEGGNGSPEVNSGIPNPPGESIVPIGARERGEDFRERMMNRSEEARERMMNGSLNRPAARIIKDYLEDYREADCNELNTTRERFLCGMHSMRKDAKIVPEECREREEDDKAACERLQERLERCREGNDTNQTRCARRALGMEERKEVREEVRECRQNSTNASQCIHELSGKVDSIILFRLDNLVKRAKMFAEKGIVTEDEAADFASSVEALKAEYKTLDLAGKKEKILEIKNLWGKFVSSARSHRNSGNSTESG